MRAPQLIEKRSEPVLSESIQYGAAVDIFYWFIENQAINSISFKIASGIVLIVITYHLSRVAAGSVGGTFLEPKPVRLDTSD